MTIANLKAEYTELGGGRTEHSLYASPIAYQSNGVFHRIQNALGNSGDPNFTLGVDELMQFRIRPRLVGNAPMMHIGRGDEHIRFTPLNTNNVDAVVVENTITYPEAWNNADLLITVAGHIVRKEIVLRTGHPTSFSFRIDKKQGDTQLRIVKPFLRKGHLYTPLSWIESVQGGKTILTATLPAGNWDGWILDPTTTMQPAEAASNDTVMSSSNPTTNFDAIGSLYAGENATEITRSVIKFDMSSITATDTCDSSTYTLTTKEDLSSNTRTHYVYRLLVAFTENQATWNDRQTSTAWNTAGAGGSGSDYDATALGSLSVTATETLNTAKNWTLSTTETKKLYDGTYTNYGFLHKADTESDDLWGFWDAGAATSSRRPKLVVVTTAAGGFVPKVTIM